MTLSSAVRTESDDSTECDVLVVGSGAAGMTAALTAAAAGLDVLVAERAHRFGGTSAISGGWMWVPGNPPGAARSGDTREEVHRYLRGLAGDKLDARRLDEYLDAVPEMLGFLEQSGVPFVYPDLSPDYRSLVAGARPGGRAIHAPVVDARILGQDRLRVRPYKKELTVLGVMPQIGPDLNAFLSANSSVSAFLYVFRRIMVNWAQRPVFRRGLDLGNGNALIAMLIASARKRGVRLVTDHEVTELRRSGDRVSGAVLHSPAGRTVVTAKVGVVVAAGGFSHDAELRRLYYPAEFDVTAGSTPMTPEHDGASIRLVRAVGGTVNADVCQPAAWASVSVFGNGGQRTFPHLRGVGLPGIIAVDQSGKRFANEADSYHEFGQALIAASAGKPAARAFLVCDAATMHRYGLGFAKPWPVPRFQHLRNGYLKSGRTLTDLARSIGADPLILEETVARFNRGALRGEDPDFGRGIGDFNRFKGIPGHLPNPSLGPLVKPPFYATEVRLGDLGTFAGIATGPGAQVVDENGAPIPGLFAAGAAAASVFAGTYPGAGAHLGPAVTFGFVAGRALASQARDLGLIASSSSLTEA
jgi:succinate dehydrogenase/fumarate reductase flavoprotein subunit